MTSPVSIGEIVSLAQLTLQVYGNWSSACGQYADITRQLNSLHVVLTALEAEASNKQSVLATRLGDMQGLSQMMGNCHDVVSQLNRIVTKYKSLGFTRARNWDRLRLSSTNYTELCNRLATHTALLSTYLDTLNFASQSRMEMKLDGLARMMSKLEQRVADKRTGKRESMVEGTHINPEQEIWDEFREELASEGITADVIRKCKVPLKQCLRKLSEEGLLDEDVPAGPDPLDPAVLAMNTSLVEKEHQAANTPRSPEDYLDVRRTVSNTAPSAVEGARVSNGGQNPLGWRSRSSTSLPSEANRPGLKTARSTEAVGRSAATSPTLLSPTSPSKSEQTSPVPHRRKSSWFRWTDEFFGKPEEPSNTSFNVLKVRKEKVELPAELSEEFLNAEDRRGAPRTATEVPWDVAIEWYQVSETELLPPKPRQVLPEGWSFRMSPGNVGFYFDEFAGKGEKKCFWKPPIEELWPKEATPPGWEKVVSIFGRIYWRDSTSGLVSYEHPYHSEAIVWDSMATWQVRPEWQANEEYKRQPWEKKPSREKRLWLCDENVTCQIIWDVWDHGLSAEGMRALDKLGWGWRRD